MVAGVLAGCGGEAGREEASEPRLPAKLAQDLAKRSDRVAATLARGDACGADAQADELLDVVVTEVNDGGVPSELAEELAGAANGLAQRIECSRVPPPPPPPPAEPATTAEEEGDEGDEEPEEPEEPEDEDGGEEEPPPETEPEETVPTEPETVPTDTGGETATTGTTTEETP